MSLDAYFYANVNISSRDIAKVIILMLGINTLMIFY